MSWTGLRYSWSLSICLFLLAPAAHSQQLVYMVSYTNTPASFRAQFPNGILGATPQQSVAMVRQTRKNEIWSASVKDGKRELLFSDAGINFEIRPVVTTGSPLNDKQRMAYVLGVERTWEAPPEHATPGIYETPLGVYEVALDGSNHFRRLFDARESMSAPVVNRAGTRLAFGAYENQAAYSLYVYELPSGKLLWATNLTKQLQTLCGGCLPQESGWLTGGKRMFLTLDPENEADEDETAAPMTPGIYILPEDGKDLRILSAHAGEMNLPDYRRQSSFFPHLIGQEGNGNYVFRDYALKKWPVPKAPVESAAILVMTDADFTIQKQIPLGRLRSSEFELSPDGSYLAFVEDRLLPSYTTERHLWVRNLQSDEEKELLLVPPPRPPTSLDPNVSLTILGWLDK